MAEEENNAPPGADTDPSNVLLRAGYIRGMAYRAGNEDDRKWLLRASRSLVAYARVLGAEIEDVS